MAENRAGGSSTMDMDNNISSTFGTDEFKGTPQCMDIEIRTEAPLTASPQHYTTNSPSSDEAVTLYHAMEKLKEIRRWKEGRTKTTNLKASTPRYTRLNRLSRTPNQISTREHRRKVLFEHPRGSLSNRASRTKPMGREQGWSQKVREEDPAAYAELLWIRAMKRKRTMQKYRKMTKKESKMAVGEQDIVAQLNGLKIVGKVVDKRVRFIEEAAIIGESSGEGEGGDVLVG